MHKQPVHAEAYAPSQASVNRQSILPELHKITASTLTRTGGKDTHYPDETELLVQKLPEARRFTVENTGHPTHVQPTRVFENPVMSFLALEGIAAPSHSETGSALLQTTGLVT